MKAFFLISMFTILTFVAVAEPTTPTEAAIPAEKPEEVSPSYPWTFINLQFFPGVPTDAGETQTNGVKVGVPVSAGEAPVYGIEGSVLWGGTDVVNGLQCSLIACDARKLTGIQFSLVNLSVKVCGLQLGIVNFAKDETFQIGILNFIENGSVFCLPFVNFKF